MNNEKNIFSLNYGNIVKLAHVDKKYDNTLFFVNYIDNKEIKLLSNNFNELILTIDRDKNISPLGIEKIIVIYNNESGYATINNLLPGKNIQITFNDDQIVQGKIINLKYDMIVVDVNNKYIYIDFHYGGLDKSYNIKSINIIDEIKDLNNGNFQKEDDEDYDILNSYENDVLVYTLDQQINDYIEKMYLTNKNKNVINNEIKKYLELLNKCTDLENNVKINKLSSNQILNTFLDFNKNIIIPVTSYINKDIYLSNEFGEVNEDDVNFQNNSITIKKPSSIFEDVEENENFLKNYFFENVKIEKYHKKIKLKYNNDVIIINKDKNIITGDLNFFSVEIIFPSQVKSGNRKKVTENLKEINYDVIYLNKNDRFIINGIIFKDLNTLKKDIKKQDSEYLLNKCFDDHYNNNIEITNLSKKKILKKKIFDKEKFSYYELSEEDTQFKDYISKLNYNIIDTYEDFFDKTEINAFDFIIQSAFFNITDLNKNDYKLVNKIIKNNTINFKKILNDINTELLKITIKYYKNISSNKLFNTIIDEYNIEESENRHMNEIFENASIDNYKLVIFQLIQDNDNLNIDFDEELLEYFDEMKKQINYKDAANNENVEISKIYESTIDLKNDENKIILKNNLNKEKNGEVFDTVDYLYKYLKSKTKYKEPIDKFIPMLDKILTDYNNENSDTLKNTLLENNDDRDNIFFNLIKKIMEFKIRKYDNCYVKNEKNVYIYDGKTWIPQKEYKNDIENKRILRLKNSLDEFDNIKKKIIDNYVTDLIQKQEKDVDINKINDKIKLYDLKKDLVQINNNNIRKLLKFNYQKNKYRYDFLKSDHLTNIVTSPYIAILYKILALEDLEDKYKLIQKFKLLFTVDNNDPSWFYCIKKNTKLLPKYLHKLSEAYLIYNNYEETINKICLEEGFLSESGDKWIHKESGYIIKNIDFDNNYGYDESGFKIVQDTVPENVVDVDIDYEEEIEFMYESEDSEKQMTINKIKQVMIRFMNVLGVSFGAKDDKIIIYNSLYNIYNKSLRKDKLFNKYGESTMIYTVLCYLIVFIQTKNVYIKKTFPGCNNSFDGYPLQEDESKINGINTVSCLLDKVIQNYKEPIYTILKENSVRQYKDEMFYYMKTYLLENSYINEELLIKRDKILNSEKLMEFKLTKPPYRFKPLLYDINTESINSEISLKSKTIYDSYLNNVFNLDLLSVRLQEHINELIEKEEPLLTTQYEEPFLINYCCNSNMYLLQHLLSKNTENDKLIYLIKKSNERTDILNSQKKLYFSTKLLRLDNILDLNYNQDIELSTEYDKETIYSFIIKHFNFDNNKDIPNHLLIFNIQKPDPSYYNSVKNESLNVKIRALEENNYLFTNEMFLNILNVNNENNYINNINIQKSDSKIEIENEEYERFKEEFLDTEMEKILDKFDLEITEKNSKYDQFINTRLNSNSIKKFKNIQSLLNYDDDINDHEKLLIINNLYNINYILIAFIPNLYLNGNKEKNIVHNHWNLADKHEIKLKEKYKEFLNFFNQLELNDENMISISRIINYKKILKIDIFKNDNDIQFYFMKYLFFELLNKYINDGNVTKEIIDINVSIINFMYYYLNKINFNYKNIKKENNQLKNAEKKKKTDYLKKMQKIERDVEKHKMAYKLGEWSYGNQKRVFKYYKELYEKEEITANQIKETMQEMYTMVESPDVNQVTDQPSDEVIMNDESLNIRMVADDDGDVVGQDGEIIEDYE
tara:strand:- start:6452 stop:11614 length:5163 start_codon:yes stop_codon:yes gene_type:complete